MKSEELKERSRQLSLRCVELGSSLSGSPLADHIRGELFKWSSSAAANCRIAFIEETRGEFAADLNAAIEGMEKSWFWMDMLIEHALADDAEVEDLVAEARFLANVLRNLRKSIEQWSRPSRN